jgi:hypothetical protein
MSNWAGTLYKEQLDYAVQDSYASLSIYNKIKELGGNERAGCLVEQSDLINDLPVTLHAGDKVVAEGKIRKLDIDEFKKYFDESKFKKKKLVVVKLEKAFFPKWKVKHYKDTSLKTLVDVFNRNHDSRYLLVDISILKIGRCVLQDAEEEHQEDEKLLSPDAEESLIVELPKSRVIVDIFHVMDRLMKNLNKKHPLYNDFIVSFRDSIFNLDDGDVKALSKYAEERCQTFDQLYLMRPDFVFKRLRRYIPRPEVLALKLRNLFEYYKENGNDELGIPLFNEEVKKKTVPNLLKLAENGVLTDPSDVDLYYRVKTDKYGLNIYRCVRGTNSCEAIHSLFMANFSGFGVSSEYLHFNLMHSRHRFNINIGRANLPHIYRFGHYDVGLIDLLYDLSRKVYSDSRFHLFKTWIHSFSFERTNEEYGIVSYTDELKTKYGMEGPDAASSSFECRLLKTRYEIRPMKCPEEKKLFKELIDAVDGYKELRLTQSWNAKADGRVIYYKTPELLDRYKRNVFDKRLTTKQVLQSMDKSKLADTVRVVETIEKPTREIVSESMKIAGQISNRFVRLDEPVEPPQKQRKLQPMQPIMRMPIIQKSILLPMNPLTYSARRITPFPTPYSFSNKTLPPLSLQCNSGKKRKSCSICKKPECSGGYKQSNCKEYINKSSKE